jgi:hypothetical protein
MTRKQGPGPVLVEKKYMKEARIRNLGSAIFLAAVRDYRSLDEDKHRDAGQFLYPRTPEAHSHYDWAVGMIEGLDPAWLRSSLGRFRGRWDGQRFARMNPLITPRRRCQPKGRR